MTKKSNTIQVKTLPMQYLGSKTRIANWIVDSILQHFPRVNTLLDLFAGTGCVSIEASNKGITTYLNDIQPYSAILLQSIFIEKRDGIDELIKYLKSEQFEKRLLDSNRNYFKALLNKENDFFFTQTNNALDWELYRRFCETTPNKWRKNEIHRLKKAHKWNLISHYYANRYFGVRQALELDLIREIAEEQEPNLRIHLIASGISAMSMNVSSTTHLAQYLRPTTKKNSIDLIKKRKGSIIEYVISNLKNLNKLRLSKQPIVTNLNFAEAIDYFGPFAKKCFLYADPPYFKEHYSRYYHVLDTFFLYDFPFLSWNSQINAVTEGLYRENRIISDFGLRSKAPKAFESLFKKAKKYNMPIALSYASTSLVKKEKITEIAKHYDYKIKILSKELVHSGQGQKRHNTVIEYLFLCVPKQ